MFLANDSQLMAHALTRGASSALLIGTRSSVVTTQNGVMQPHAMKGLSKRMLKEKKNEK
jgi:hypothetical protein